MADKKNKPTEINDEDLDGASGGLLDYGWIGSVKERKGSNPDQTRRPNSFTTPGDVAGVKK